MKCEICNDEIQTIFLKKIMGTVVKDENGKKHYICNGCQSRVGNEKSNQLENITTN